MDDYQGYLILLIIERRQKNNSPPPPLFPFFLVFWCQGNKYKCLVEHTSQSEGLALWCRPGYEGFFAWFQVVHTSYGVGVLDFNIALIMAIFCSTYFTCFPHSFVHSCIRWPYVDIFCKTKHTYTKSDGDDWLLGVFLVNFVLHRLFSIHVLCTHLKFFMWILLHCFSVEIYYIINSWTITAYTFYHF